MPTTGRLTAITALALVVGQYTAGCQPMGRTPGTSTDRFQLPPIPDRLRAYYKELKAGRFEVLADFEQPEQVQIFAVEGQGRVRLTARRSRLATGAGALEVRFDDAQSTLIVQDRGATDWALPRDWRRFELLMASVYAVEPAVVSLQVVSGFEHQVSWRSQPVPLSEGWNLLRIDLADVGRTVDLADVRQIRMTLQARKVPVLIYLDDLIVADNTNVIFGAPGGEKGSLYVLKKGRRLHVGSVGRFELVFNRGLLDGWHELVTNSKERPHLVGNSPLGPVLVALDRLGRPIGPIGIECWRGLGQAVQTELRLAEANRLAVTIEGRIRFGAERPSNTSDGQQPTPARKRIFVEHRYTYTVRTDGRTFVGIRATVGSQDFQPDRIGLAVTAPSGLFELQKVDVVPGAALLDQGRQAEQTAVANAQAQRETPQSVLDKPRPRGLLLRGTSSDSTTLVLVPHKPAEYVQLIVAESEASGTTAYILLMTDTVPKEVQLSAMIAVWPPDLRDLVTAAEMARDYQEPRPPVVEVGRLRTDSPGDLDGDGFDECSGIWTLEPDGPILRLRWPAGRLRFWPMFRLTGTVGKACWAYFDGQIVKSLERDRDGQAVFVLPEILSRTALLEVTIEQ